MRNHRRGTAVELRRHRRKPSTVHDLPCGRFPLPQMQTFTWVDPPTVREYQRHFVVENDGTLVRVRVSAGTAPSGGDFTVKVKRWRPSTDHTITLYTITLADGNHTHVKHGDFASVEEADHIFPEVTEANGVDDATLHITCR